LKKREGFDHFTGKIPLQLFKAIEKKGKVLITLLAKFPVSFKAVLAVKNLPFFNLRLLNDYFITKHPD